MEAVDNMVGNITGLCKEDLGDKGVDLSVVTLETSLLGDDDSDFREWSMPGLICASLFFFAIYSMELKTVPFLFSRFQTF